MLPVGTTLVGPCAGAPTAAIGRFRRSAANCALCMTIAYEKLDVPHTLTLTDET